MLKLTIENTVAGPLDNPSTRHALEELVDRSRTLEQVAAGVDAIPGLTAYRGSMHVAVHSHCRGQFSPTRWALIVEG